MCIKFSELEGCLYEKIDKVYLTKETLNYNPTTPVHEEQIFQIIWF